MRFKIGEYALLQGQIVQIKNIKQSFNQYTNSKLVAFDAQIKLVDDKLLHWIKLEQLQPLPKQTAAKVLFNSNKSRKKYLKK